ncbi:hypothetical protein Pelo_18704, partial [Pelomyxa schiedti]
MAGSLVLSSLLLLVVSSTALWQEYLYYEQPDYTTCSNLIYVEVEDVSTCSESTCYVGYEYNYMVKCHDVMPDIDSYFDEEYYSTTTYSDMLGTKVTEFSVAKKSCVWSYWYDDYRGWTCDGIAGKITEYDYSSDSTCTTSGSSYKVATPSQSNRWADVFYCSSSKWYTVDCGNIDTPVSGYQLITYYAVEQDSTSTCASSAILGYEYFHTDDCIVQDCGSGPQWKESWSCSDTEPDPATLVPDTANPPFILQYIDTNDNFCSGDVFTTQVWKSSCLPYSSTSLQVVESGSYLNFEMFYSSTDCTGTNTNEDYIYKGGDFVIPGCYSTYENVWYTLTKNQVANEKYQTVEYYAGADTTATPMMIEQYFSHYCETKTV